VVRASMKEVHIQVCLVKSVAVGQSTNCTFARFRRYKWPRPSIVFDVYI